MQNDTASNQTTSYGPLPSPTHSTQNITHKIKIKPIPIIRKSLPNSPKPRTKLRANGYKYFSKISAAGPPTFRVLQNMNQSSSLKIMQKFEFDPYLCDGSYLTELKIVLKKLKTIKQLTIVIRRVNNDPREINKLKAIGSGISKMIRLRKLRVEFPCTSNVEESHILAVYRSLRKCYFLRSLEWILVESPLMGIEYYKLFGGLMHNLRKLEHYKDYWSIKKGIPNCDPQELEQLGDLPKSPQLKHIEMMYSIAKEWSHMGENGDITNEMIKEYLASHTGLVSFKLQVIKCVYNCQDILVIMQCFASLVHFRHLEIEFLNCAIGDIEIAVFVYGLSLIPQLKSVRLKVLQSSPISIDYIEKVVDKVSGMSNIEKFDFYFRKQYLSKGDIPRIEKIFSKFRDVKCSCSPQSIYVYKTQP